MATDASQLPNIDLNLIKELATLPSGYYQRLAGSTDDVDDTSAMSIEKGTVALAQPFRHHVILQSPKGSEVLARIMYATLQHHASLQYSRSLHQLAALVLVVLGANREEQAFWTLIGLVTARLFPAAKGQCALGSYIEHGVLQRLVAKKQSSLSSHWYKIEGVTAGWMSTCFTSHLPPETAVRAWDSILCEGNKVMHRVALALLRRYETVISSSSIEAVMLKILEMRIGRTTDAEELMAEAFNNIGSMPGSLLVKYRQEVAASPELTRFMASHAISSGLKLEEQPAPLCNAPPALPGGGGLRSWLDSGMRSLSRRNSRESSSMAGSSYAGSDGGYSSGGDGGGDGAVSSTMTASGRPRPTSGGRRVTIMQPAAPGAGTASTQPAAPGAGTASTQPAAPGAGTASTQPAIVSPTTGPTTGPG